MPGTVLPPGIELFGEEKDKDILRWEDGRLDEIVSSREAGIGLRTIGREVRFVHMEARRPLSRGLGPEEDSRLRRLAAGMGHGGGRPRRVEFPRPPRREGDGPSHADKTGWFRRAERAARADPRVRQVHMTVGESDRAVSGISVDDAPFVDRRRYVTFTIHVTASAGGLTQSATEVLGGLGGWDAVRGFSPARIAARAARRALMKLEAPVVAAGEMPVVIAAEAGGTLIHEAVGHSLEADSIQDGSSPHFAGRVGRVVAHPKITVLDDPTRPGQRGSYRCDDEGTPAERTVLIENGVLRTYLYDRRTARRDRRTSNGHGRRESFSHPPIPRMSNTFIAPGPDDPRLILAGLARGLYVTRLGGGQVNTATGDFIFEVEEGHWVEDGRVRHPVRGANLLGNGPEVLRTIDQVGWDLGWSVGTCGKENQGAPVSDGLPTLRIPKVVVGGSSPA